MTLTRSFEHGDRDGRRSDERCRRDRHAPGLVVLLALGALAGITPAAGASTASLSAGVLTIDAGPGETNAIVVTSGNANPLWVEDSAGITPGAGCEPGSVPTRVLCFIAPAGLSAAAVVVSLGDGNDSFDAGPAGGYVAKVTADGGPGDDRIVGSDAGDVLRGGDGNDDLGGSAGEDQVHGEAGDDTVRGQAGADTVSGGPGLDLIEGDGQGIYGNGGSDAIDSRDGARDRVTCGLGADVLTADAIDTIEMSECESVDTGGGPAPAPAPGPAPAAAPVLAFVAAPSSRLSKLGAGSGPAFRFSASAACTAVVRLTVSAAEARRTRLGRGAVTLLRDSAPVPEAGTYEGRLTIAGRYRRKVRALRRLRTTLTITCSSSGSTTRVSRALTFRR